MIGTALSKPKSLPSRAGAQTSGNEQWVIISREPCDDLLGADTQILHDLCQRFERRAWIGVCVLSAREPFFLIVADDPQTACGCHLDERGSRVVESTDADAGEIGRFAARQSCDQLLRLLRRKMAI